MKRRSKNKNHRIDLVDVLDTDLVRIPHMYTFVVVFYRAGLSSGFISYFYSGGTSFKSRLKKAYRLSSLSLFVPLSICWQNPKIETQPSSLNPFSLPYIYTGLSSYLTLITLCSCYGVTK